TRHGGFVEDRCARTLHREGALSALRLSGALWRQHRSPAAADVSRLKHPQEFQRIRADSRRLWLRRGEMILRARRSAVKTAPPLRQLLVVAVVAFRVRPVSRPP